MANKKTPTNTLTRDLNTLAAPTGNIYESVVILAKRANQIAIAETQTLLQIGLGPSSEEQAMVELRPVRQQSGFTHSGSLLLQGQ